MMVHIDVLKVFTSKCTTKMHEYVKTLDKTFNFQISQDILPLAFALTL